MKRIAITTSYYINNYGTVLQTFATQEVLKKLGVQPELISVKIINSEIKRKRMKFFLRSALTSNYLIYKKGMIFARIWKKVGIGRYAKSMRVRDLYFEKFRNTELVFSPIYNSLKELSSVVQSRYDAVIVGSDQLWLPSNIAGDFFTLSFVPNNIRKISYSTSFGQAVIPKYMEDDIVRFISRIDKLSVREKSGCEIIKKITGRNATLVLDPVLLLTANEWEKHCRDNKKRIKGDYIFCYFLGKDRRCREEAIRMKRNTGLLLVNIPHLEEYIREDELYADIILHDISPFDFIDLIKNATYVFTDSFHCTAFSVLFHKEFYVFRRYVKKTELSTNGRIDSLLNMLGLRGRIIEGSDINNKEFPYEPIQYQGIDNRIDELKKSSMDFLSTAIEG